MSVQWYAAFVLVVGLGAWLVGDVLGSVVAVLFFSLFGGGAAFLIGTTSIQPVSVCLVFLLAHVLFSMFSRSSHINIGLKTNGYLAFFCFYGAITAFILPKIFARQMVVPPMLINKADVYYVSALGFSRQNITTAVYLLGTLIAAVCAGAAVANIRSRRVIVDWALIISWLHIGFGVAGVIATKVGGTAIIHFFRNAKYAELNEATQGFVRMDGIFPEPSSYGGYAFTWFVFMVELWLRNVKTRWTGITAAALFVALIACTSTSAYFSLAVYAAVLLTRWALAPGGLRAGKIILIGMGGLTALTLVLAAVAFIPSVAALAGRAVSALTLHKLDSTSGLQRAFWAKAGLKAFVVSHGLGIGAGSFRCSSLLLSILGSTGVIGAGAFAAHILHILQPLRARTYRLRGAGDGVGVAAAWAACAGLLPAVVNAASPDPGVLFGVLGGLALGWRYAAAPAEAAQARADTARPRVAGGPAGMATA